jgi:hypothetical protein
MSDVLEVLVHEFERLRCCFAYFTLLRAIAALRVGVAVVDVERVRA